MVPFPFISLYGYDVLLLLKTLDNVHSYCLWKVFLRIPELKQILHLILLSETYELRAKRHIKYKLLVGCATFLQVDIFGDCVLLLYIKVTSSMITIDLRR